MAECHRAKVNTPVRFRSAARGYLSAKLISPPIEADAAEGTQGGGEPLDFPFFEGSPPPHDFVMLEFVHEATEAQGPD